MKKEYKFNNEEEYRALVERIQNDKDQYECLHSSRDVLPSTRMTIGVIYEASFYHVGNGDMNPEGALYLKSRKTPDSFEAECVIAASDEHDLEVLRNIVRSSKQL